MRYHLNKLSIQDLESVSSRILTEYVDTVLKRGQSYQFAINYTHDPYYGKKNEEIATQLKITLLTVKTQKKKALRYIREKMQDFGLLCILLI